LKNNKQHYNKSDGALIQKGGPENGT